MAEAKEEKKERKKRRKECVWVCMCVCVFVKERECNSEAERLKCVLLDRLA